MRKRKGLKLLALMLAAIMCINSMNLSVFAEESTEVIEETAEMSTSEVSTETVEESSEETAEETSGTEEGITAVETVIDDAEEETESDASEETEQESVEEKKTESVYEGSNYKVTFALSSQWEGGYNANVKIENTGDSIIENWYLAFALDNAITNIWNAQIDNQEENEYVIKNAGWNADIPVGGSVEFGLSSNENFVEFPEIYNLLGESTEADENDYTVEYIVDCDWGTGFTGRILITNNTEETIEDWVLEFDFDREITQIWDAVIEEHEGNHYVVKNNGYNAEIKADQVISFGFSGSEGTAEDAPTNYCLSSYEANLIDPMEVDTDEDGLLDGYESSILGTELQKRDSDDNGLEDGKEDFDDDELQNLEEFLLGTNPFGFDTDEDGFSDKYEVDNGMNPLVYDEVQIDSSVAESMQDYAVDDLVILNLDEYYPLEVAYNDEQTQIISISGVYSEQQVDSPINALYSIYNVKSLLGLDAPGEELKYSKLFHSQSGTTYTFSQFHDGIEVYGRTLTVSVDNDGKVSSLRSSVIDSGILGDICVIPQITENEMHSVVYDECGEVEIISEQLVLYVDENNLVPELAYVVDISNYDTIIISADSGGVIGKYENTVCATTIGSGVDEHGNTVSFPVNEKGFFSSKTFRLEDVGNKIHMYDCNNNNQLITSNNNVWTDGVALSAYTNTIAAYNWWKNEFGYKGIDGVGGAVGVYVHDSKWPNNAAYSPANKTIHFGDMNDQQATYASALDVVGHEYTHAVFRHKMEMKNIIMLRTIEEAYADIFGSFINHNTWMTSLRNISNPAMKGNPGYIGSPHYNPTTKDPHHNSTIISHAAYTMYDTYNFSFDQLKVLWYDSMGEGFDNNSDFNTVRYNVINSARKNKFSYEEILNIKKAFEDVGVYGDKGDAEIIVYDGGTPVVDAKVTFIFYGDNMSQKTDASGTALVKDLNTGLNTVKLEIAGREPIYTTMMLKKGEIVSKTINILTSMSNFTWDEYDHYNFSQPYVSTIPKHIEFTGNDIKMIGYTVQPFKDFLLTNGNDDPTSFVQASQKILSFNIIRDNNSWHTIEGGGFLFNVDIIKDALYGHCILVTAQGLKLYELKNVDIERFRNGKLGDISSVGLLLGTYDIGNVLDNHKITLRITDNMFRKQISLWDGDKLIIDDLELVNCFGEDFGPITSHTSHYCSQVSYFTFSDIQMSSVQ